MEDMGTGGKKMKHLSQTRLNLSGNLFSDLGLQAFGEAVSRVARVRTAKGAHDT